ncbi:MAG: cbb3-type cytochrome c oxidase subunit I [Flavobacterium sp.]|jgi:cytochrome c oxidase subunit 1|uniref:cytochrome c oxidase subunit I n=1 Tax=Flavobacterium TaxID=237 RepID=UPI000C1A1EC3|nr:MULTISPECIES: cbb3-type cytochrome c oxidase subunit I [Flavobacterium]MDI5886727.1 cbb3-type cytochrome c oxidase subunit I [Flavobacterium yafengii]MDP3680945.1 cbb3-type cytochrome c oxidase subunit I [Flavobacterium sp.]PIF61686.1 cytochrome c oxidase subunit 1 [Flavobacterium sp. 11]RKS15381.1 cytochrome c oxidase subunit 1 [Flavobacterium sp. 120]WKL42791.1 cbb3-type cytochrome c oxidase subunit I [Flavobacterium sp. ZE23DGlu08]
MSAEGHDHAIDHEHEHHHKDTFITKYIFSIDHKMIAKQYLITGIIMGIIGVGMSMLFRMQLAWPEESFKIFNILLGDKFAPNGVMTNDIYLALVTIHGTIMVFFVLTAALSGTFSNLLIPLQIGARDMASGFMNMISYWLFFLSSIIMVSSLFVEAGPASSGWTIYPPLSALPQAIPGSGLGMTLWLVSMAIFIASSLMGSLNYVVTVINLRTKGMTMTRLPLTIWAFFVTAIIGIVSFPVLLSAALLLIFDRSFGTSFFLSDIYIAGEVLHYQGGSPVLFEHLFWFLGHPEVYIVLLPALGITSEVIATNSRKPIFGYRAMIMSILAIAFLSTIVWGHHMFISGMNPFLGSVFTFTTLLIAIPSAVKAFNYITTLWKGNLQLNPAMLFSIGLVSTFITGGLTGIILGDSTLDINVHDTYFVVAHFHLVMGISALYGMFAGIYHWFPRMFGRMLNKNLGYVHFWVTAICAYGVFFPMHFIGLAGLPRRYYTNTNFPLFDDLQNVNVLITTFALIGGVFQLVFLYNFFVSIFYGKKSVMNPWKSNTLEWTAPVEHMHGNWPGEIPHVYRWPYDYSNPAHDVDFVPQNVPMKEGEEVLHH